MDDYADDFETFELNQLAADDEGADGDDLDEVDDTELGVVAALTAARAAHAAALVDPHGNEARTADLLHAAAERVEDEGIATGLALETAAAFRDAVGAGPMGIQAWARQALTPAERAAALEARLYSGHGQATRVHYGCDKCGRRATVMVIGPRGADGTRCVPCLRPVHDDLKAAGAVLVGIADTSGAVADETHDTLEEREMDRLAYETLSAGGVL